MQFSESFFAARFGITRHDLENYLAEALSQGGDYADLYFEYLATSSIGIDESIVKSATQGVSMGVGVRVIAGRAHRLRLQRRLSARKRSARPPASPPTSPPAPPKWRNSASTKAASTISTPS